MRFISSLLALLAVTAAASAAALDVNRLDIIPEGASVVEATGGSGGGHGSHRRRVTIRASRNDHDDVADDFLWALKRANKGGTLVLEKGKKYVLGKKLDLTFLDNVWVNLEGELKFTNDIEYWQANNFYYPFQKSITFWVWGGKDIRIYGGGTLNGNGQAWYDGFAGFEILDPGNTYLRPILFLTDNATNVAVEGIRFLNSPCWTTFLVRTKDITFDGVRIDAFSTNVSSLPKNTDGFDSYNTDGLTVLNTEVNVGDDCFSPKPNTTNILVKNLWCNGTHGVSMGSIGQYPGTLDYISNAHLENITLLNGQNGARLKAWAGPNVGYGYIRNITYKDVLIENTDAPIVLDQCYFNINSTACAQYPSKVDISGVKFINIHGSSSGKNGKVVADLTCSPGATCDGIHLEAINITSPAGSPSVIVCDNIQGDIGVDCVSAGDVE